MEKFQGEDIDFRLVYEKGEDFNIESFRGFDEIIVYAYTNGCVVIRFSTSENEHFEKLTFINDSTLSGVIKGEYSKLLKPGLIYIEITAVLPGGEKRMIERASTSIVLKKSLIKAEQ